MSETLYNFLPSIFRRRDQEQEGHLKALLSVVEKEMDLVKADIESLYANWFAETCDEWALPYIGRLLGITDLRDQENIVTSQRRRIANAIRYRRRKGIVPVLENIIHDVTGWHTKVIEYFDRLNVSFSLLNFRDNRGKTLDIRDLVQIENIDTPFDSSAHIVDVRSMNLGSFEESKGGGLYNVDKVGIFLWRVNSYASLNCTACKNSSSNFTFSRMGLDKPLFNMPLTEPDLTAAYQRHHLPVRISRNVFQEDLLKYEQEYEDTPSQHRPDYTTYYGSNLSLDITVKGVHIPPLNLVSADLSDWNVVNLEKDISVEGSPVVAVDPELGRIAFSEDYIQNNPLEEGDVIVDFHYGFSADIGGGPYNRRETMAQETSEILKILVSKESEISSLPQALQAWLQDNSDYKKCIIRIEDNGVYSEDLSIELPAGSKLVIEAADGVNPAIRQSDYLTITGLTDPDEYKRVDLTINGISIDKPLMLKGTLNLNIIHSSIIFSTPENISDRSIETDNDASELRISILHSIVWPLFISSETTTSLTVKDSIIDGGQEQIAIAADRYYNQWGPRLDVQRSTILGKVYIKELIGSETIFASTVYTQRTQVGYARFCYIPDGSETSAIYRCQPMAAIQSKILEAQGDTELTQAQKDEIKEAVLERIHLGFTSVRYGDPGYAQLSRLCALEILTGAEDEAEIGAFQHLHQRQREENLKGIIYEYLRSDLEAAIFYMT